MSQHPYWKKEEQPARAPLSENISVDVAIVGGGMSGLMCAQALLGSGLTVAIFEKEICGAGASGRSSGFITPDSEVSLSALVEKVGKEKAHELWEFVTSGVEAIRETIQTQKISCEYEEQNSFFVAGDTRGIQTIKDEYEARTALGYTSTLIEQSTMAETLGSPRYKSGVEYGGTFAMNTFLFCQGLANVLAQKGISIYEQTPISAIADQTLIARGYTVTARSVVSATGITTNTIRKNPLPLFHVQTFLGITKPLPAETLTRIFPKKKLMVWDTDMVYQYIRPTNDNRLLVGCSDLRYTYAQHSAKKTDRMKRKMHRYLVHSFPEIELPLDDIWSGMIDVTQDLLPLAGEDCDTPHHYYIAGTAGLPWAAALGIYIAEKITAGRSDLDRYFSAERTFDIPKNVERIIGKPTSYALAHAHSKYRGSYMTLIPDLFREIGKMF